MKELQENTIEQIRILLRYLSETDLLKNKDILMCLDVLAREKIKVIWRSSKIKIKLREKIMI